MKYCNHKNIKFSRKNKIIALEYLPTKKDLTKVKIGLKLHPFNMTTVEQCIYELGMRWQLSKEGEWFMKEG